MKKDIEFDVIAKDFELTIEQEETIINFIHSLACQDVSRKLIYNEITTKGFTQKQLQFAFYVMGFYDALRMLGVIIDE